MARALPKSRDEDTPGAGSLSELPPHLVRQFAEMATLIPDTESDGGAGILEDILGAISIEDLDRPFQEKDEDFLVGETLIWESISKSPSDFKDGLGIFLVCQVVRESTGEQFTVTTGSMSVVAQLVKAYTLDALPLRAKLRRADKPTKSGYYPKNLVIDRNQPSK
jgi:hypothetical protein